MFFVGDDGGLGLVLVPGPGGYRPAGAERMESGLVSHPRPAGRAQGGAQCLTANTCSAQYEVNTGTEEQLKTHRPPFGRGGSLRSISGPRQGDGAGRWIRGHPQRSVTTL